MSIGHAAASLALCLPLAALAAEWVKVPTPDLNRHWYDRTKLDVFSQEPLAQSGHPMSALYKMDNVILSPHLTFYTAEAMARLTDDTLARCREVLEGRPVLVKSHDPRLRAQRKGVVFGD